MNYCKCKFSSPTIHHNYCLNEGCGEKIKTIYEKYNELESKLKIQNKKIQKLKGFITCVDCDIEDTCEFSYDAYNTNGDCLASK